MTGRRPGDPHPLKGSGDMARIGNPRPIGGGDQPPQGGAKSLEGMLAAAGMLTQMLHQSSLSRQAQPYTGITTKRNRGVRRDSSTPGAFYVSVNKVSGVWKAYATDGTIEHLDTGTDYAPIRTYLPVTFSAAGYSISSGDKLFVQVDVNKRGKPKSGTVSIVVGSADADNFHYIPDVDETGGADGTYHYKIAEFTETSGVMSVKQIHMGSPLIAEQDILEAQFVGGGQPVIKLFDDAKGCWTYHNINGGPLNQIFVELQDGGDGLQVVGNGVITGVSDVDRVTVIVVDGLVTALSGTSTENGVHAIIEIYASSFTAEGDLDNPDYEPLGIIYFYFGKLVYAQFFGSTTVGVIPDYGDDDVCVIRVNRNVIP